MQAAIEALKALKSGNSRFVENVRSVEYTGTQANPQDHASSQQPFAIIVGCSDSRVPAETIFDQDLGSLFVVRIAGNIVSTSQLGSVEFAVQQFGSPLIVVLGHSNCGAVAATINQLNNPNDSLTPSVSAIVEHVSPAVKPLLQSAVKDDHDALLARAVRANVELGTNTLRNESTILKEYAAQGKLSVVGAEYSLDTGEVDFFDGVPEV